MKNKMMSNDFLDHKRIIIIDMTTNLKNLYLYIKQISLHLVHLRIIIC